MGCGFAVLLLAYTRVHLGVHFLGDIWAGTLLGSTLGAFLLVSLYPRAYDFFNLQKGPVLDKWKKPFYLAGVVLLLLRYLYLAKYAS